MKITTTPGRRSVETYQVRNTSHHGYSNLEQVPDIHKTVAANLDLMVKFRFKIFLWNLMGRKLDPYVHVDTSNTTYRLARYTADQILEIQRRQREEWKRWDKAFTEGLDDLLCTE